MAETLQLDVDLDAQRCLLPEPAVLGQPLVNGYLSTILGKRTSGRVLNVGAGAMSRQYRYDLRLNNTSYETLEISGDTAPTYVGDVCSMPEIPSESFDWVLAVAVLEHVKDMPAAVAEIHRVLVPGGRAYLSVPLHNDIHFGDNFGDYWRVTPFGWTELLRGRFALEEMEFWGDCIVDPVSISVIARKGVDPIARTDVLYKIEGGFDAVDGFIDGRAPFAYAMPVYRLKLSAIDYIRSVRAWRASTFGQTGMSLSSRDSDRALFSGNAVLTGHVVITNDRAEFKTA